jgi:hypothetical protein
MVDWGATREAAESLEAAAGQVAKAAGSLQAAADTSSQADPALDEFLSQLALQQLGFQLGEFGSQAQLAVTLIALNVALAIADLATRAEASRRVLGQVSAFDRFWWAPLLGFALSAFLLAMSARGLRKLIGPDPEKVRSTIRGMLTRSPQFPPLRLMTLLLIDAFGDNESRARGKHLALWQVSGIVVLLLTVIGTAIGLTTAQLVR